MTEKVRRQRDRRLTSKTVGKERRLGDRRDYTDRRTAVRVAIDLWMEEQRGDDLYFRRSCNMSVGGVFFEQSVPHPVGTRVTLRFSLPGSSVEMKTSGEVITAARKNDGLGMGVRFIDMSDEHRGLLETYIHDVSKHRGQ